MLQKLKTIPLVTLFTLHLACTGAFAEIGVEGEQVISTFTLLSAFDRRSGLEAQAARWIIAEARRAQAAGVKVTWETDSVGNVLLRKAGTGHYAGHTVPIGLQAHIDMVGAVKGAMPGEDLAPYFKGGVKLRRKGDWLQSVGNLTTIGADNGIGVAMALRYLLNPDIEHPPLEIIFTVEEENTFKGVRNLRFLLTSPVILNLDGESDVDVWVGSMGFGETAATIQLPGSTGLTGRYALRVSLQGLRGGHSGMAVHQKIVNSARAGLALIEEARALDPDIGLASFGAGTEAVSNVIPSTLVMDLLPSSEAAATAVMRGLSEKWGEILAEATDEEASAVIFTVRPAPTRADKAKGISRDNLARITRVVGSLRQGVIATDARYPDSVKTSVNTGYLYLTPGTGNTFSARFNSMSRSFDNGERAALDRGILRRLNALKSRAVGWDLKLVREIGGAWQDDSNWVLPILQRLSPQRKKTFANGTLETGVMSLRYPGRVIVSIGPNILYPHEPREQVSLTSVQETTVLLDRLVAEIAGSPNFTLPCRHQVHVSAEEPAKTTLSP